MSNEIRSRQLLIVDDHPIICQAVTSLFAAEERFKPCLLAHSIAEAHSVAEFNLIDVALVDIHLPDGSGFTLTQQLKAIFPSIKVILFSALHEQLAAGWSLHCGADGMLCKDAEPRVIIDVVDRAFRGEPAFQPRAYRWLMNNLRGELSEGISRLSPREMNVFSRIGQGYNSKEISAELEISPRTVETYHRNIREKLCLPHHDALVRAAALFVGYGGGHAEIDAEARLLSNFESQSISEGNWTHRAHLTIAYLYLSRLSYDQAFKLISSGVKRLNLAHGKPNAYHETMTAAFAKLIKSRLVTSPIWLSASEFLKANFDLISTSNSQKALLTYYSSERLNSEEARKGFIEPDLKDLPSI